jgi:nitrogen fixation/metabolism regulation signal transduction histidine kinase
MRPTIKNKLLLGFSGVLLLMTAVSGIGTYAVFSLRRSAQETTRIGDRLNSIAVEIQVHNLEAQQKARNYFLEKAKMGEENARATYLDEADFEIHEIQSLADKAVQIAPSEDVRGKFKKVQRAVKAYVPALQSGVKASQQGASAKGLEPDLAAYEQAAEDLHEAAEDGEIAGHDVAQTFQLDIERISKRSVALVIGFSIAGLVLALTVSFGLARAILVPVAHLREVAESISLGNLNVVVKRHSNDEIGDLSDSFSRMVTAVKFFQMEAETVQAEAAAGGASR